MANAKNDGVYTLDGARFLIKKGETLPDGAVMDGAEAPAPPEPEASEEKGKKSAKSGPSETTEAAAVPETTEAAPETEQA